MKVLLVILCVMFSTLSYAGIQTDGSIGKDPISAPMPATQTIAAGGTINADACGGIKRITAADGVTTDTTNTFTAPSSSNLGCCMDIINVGAQTITLDNNTNFKSASAGNVALGAADTVRVCSTGDAWYQIGGTGNN